MRKRKGAVLKQGTAGGPWLRRGLVAVALVMFWLASRGSNPAPAYSSGQSLLVREGDKALRGSSSSAEEPKNVQAQPWLKAEEEIDQDPSEDSEDDEGTPKEDDDDDDYEDDHVDRGESNDGKSADDSADDDKTESGQSHAEDVDYQSQDDDDDVESALDDNFATDGNDGNDDGRDLGDESTESDNCPLVVGLGPNVAGAKTLLRLLAVAAGDLSFVTEKDGFWGQGAQEDLHLLKVLDAGQTGSLQYDLHAHVYGYQISQICPHTLFYHVERDPLQVVLAFAAELNLDETSQCGNDSQVDIPPVYAPLLAAPDDEPLCLLRLAHNVRIYNKAMQVLLDELRREEPPALQIVSYENLVRDVVQTTQDLCGALDTLDDCDNEIDSNLVEDTWDKEAAQVLPEFSSKLVSQIQAILDGESAESGDEDGSTDEGASEDEEDGSGNTDEKEVDDSKDESKDEEVDSSDVEEDGSLDDGDDTDDGDEATANE
jgi:hypothetical protein